MHMLRVAACSYLIIDNWNGPEKDKEAIKKGAKKAGKDIKKAGKDIGNTFKDIFD